jgi:hypothetical protein
MCKVQWQTAYKFHDVGAEDRNGMLLAVWMVLPALVWTAEQVHVLWEEVAYTWDFF